MNVGTAWEAFDPATPALSVVGSGSIPGDVEPHMLSGLPFWHPSHEMFGFGLLIAATAAALYIVNEKGSSIGGHVNVGPAHASTEAGLGED